MKTVSIDAKRRAWLELDGGALERNGRTLLRRLPSGCRLLPMVKAGAYGLDTAFAVRHLARLDPWGFGVATVPEGMAVRGAGWTGPVVVFTPCPWADPPLISETDLQAVVPELEALRAYAVRGRRRGRPVPVHLEVDTGMGRLGVSWRDAGGWAPAVGEVLAAGGVRLAGTLTHFHSAAEDEQATRLQWSRFAEALEALRAHGVDPGRVHACNSAAALRYPEYAADLVRPGIFLFGGGGPGPEASRPVAAVRARVLQVREVEAGATVSYGATWTASRPSRLATLAVGYGDGVPRALSNRGRVLIAGGEAPIRGAVCMDSTVVDVTGLASVRPGDVATVLGRDGGKEIGLDEMAGLCDTIDYEILAGLGARLPRVEAGTDAEASGVRPEPSS